MTGKHWLLIILWLFAIGCGLYLYGLNSNKHNSHENAKPHIAENLSLTPSEQHGRV